jgi:Trypsin
MDGFALHVSIRCLGDHICPRGVPVAQRPIISHTLLSFFRLLHIRRCRLLRRRRFLIYNNSLIAGDILLTTAECAFAFQPDQEVYLGGILRDGADATHVVTVSRTLFSPLLGIPESFNNNIMLVQIVEDMSGITPAVFNADAAVPVDGATCFAIGYGWTEPGNPSLSDVLLQVQVPIISNGQCAESYNFGDVLPDDFICAGSEFGRGACAFDNGSPLLCNGVFVGLVAYDVQYLFLGCGVAGLPAVRIVKFVAGRCERNENIMYRSCRRLLLLLLLLLQVFARLSTSDVFIRSEICAQTALMPPSYCSSLIGSGDLCSNAVAVTPGFHFGSTIDANNDNVGLCGTINFGPGVWYSFVGDGTSYTVDTCFFADFDTRITILKGSCDLLMCVDGNDQSVDQDCGEGKSRISFPTENDVTYFVLVHGNNDFVGA